MRLLYSLSMYYIFTVTFLNEIVTVNPSLFKFLLVAGILVLIISALSITRGFQLWVSVICLLLGHILVFSNGLSFDIWYSSITKLSAIIVLFAVIPMISFPIKYGNYLDSIEGFLGKYRNRTSLLFIFMSILHTMLALTLDIGSIPTVHRLIGHINLPRKYLVRLYTSGYASFIVFSPYSGLVNLLLLLAVTSYAAYCLSGIVMLVFIVGVSTLLIKFDRPLMEQLKASMPKVKEDFSMKKIYELMLGIVLLILIAVIVGELIPVSNVIYAIVLILIIYSLFWGFLIKILKSYKAEFKNYNSNILVFKSIIPFLICTGFLGAVVSETNLNSIIQSILSYLNIMPMYFVIFSLILITMICGVCGIHMMIPVITMAMTLTPALLNLSPEAFVLMLLSCWFIAMSISPFAPFAAVVGETIEEKIPTITFKYNLKFAIVMLFISPAVIGLLNLIWMG
jgi:C4-dicarboxylate transporter, DcuC family